jgi:hypothetical protein
MSIFKFILPSGYLIYRLKGGGKNIGHAEQTLTPRFTPGAVSCLPAGTMEIASIGLSRRQVISFIRCLLPASLGRSRDFSRGTACQLGLAQDTGTHGNMIENKNKYASIWFLVRLVELSATHLGLFPHLAKQQVYRYPLMV